MILVFNHNAIEAVPHEIKPTIFPDGTSQVWKLNQSIFDYDAVNIEWRFEKEAEFIWLAQLVDLLHEENIGIAYLHIPYLPYARQDKQISNNQTFALGTFAKLLSKLKIRRIFTTDVHSDVAYELIENLFDDTDIYPYINNAITKTNPNTICFPDIGARKRYEKLLNHIPSFTGSKIEKIHSEKIRDLTTGKITKHEISHALKDNIVDKKILIIDDICDGGATFIGLAKHLYEMGAKDVYLYVTHGIFSKGLHVLQDAGIKRIFVKNTEIERGVVKGNPHHGSSFDDFLNKLPDDEKREIKKEKN